MMIVGLALVSVVILRVDILGGGPVTTAMKEVFKQK